MLSNTEAALEARARRAAERVGLIASKSRRRRNSCDNQGGFLLADCNNHVVAGARYELTAEDVIAHCADLPEYRLPRWDRG